MGTLQRILKFQTFGERKELIKWVEDNIKIDQIVSISEGIMVTLWYWTLEIK